MSWLTLYLGCAAANLFWLAIDTWRLPGIFARGPQAHNVTAWSYWAVRESVVQEHYTWGRFFAAFAIAITPVVSWGHLSIGLLWVGSNQLRELFARCRPSQH